MELTGDRRCFGCGPENPIGLQLRFELDGEAVRATFRPRPEYQGYAGLLHGGIITTALDEAMGHLMYALGEHAVTADLNVRFKKPVQLGEALEVRAWITGRRGKLVDLAASIALPDGTLAALAAAKFVKVVSRGNAGIGAGKLDAE